MSQEYKIAAVSPQTKSWSSQHGEFITYYIKVEGDDEPVQLNKKSGSPKPQVGEELYGSINTSEYGKKFKSEKRPFNKDNPDKQNQIKAQWAIGQAKDWVLQTTQDFGEIERTAAQFFAMVDRIKTSQLPTTIKSTVVTETKKDVVVDPDEINLDDIPF